MTDPLSHLPGYSLRRAASTMIAELGTRLAPLHLRVTEATVLMLAGGRSDLTSSEIGRILDIQRANMVPLLSRLETAGLVERVPLDRKSSAVVLTREGSAKLDEINAVTSRFETDLLGKIPPEHRDHLLPALHALWN